MKRTSVATKSSDARRVRSSSEPPAETAASVAARAEEIAPVKPTRPSFAKFVRVTGEAYYHNWRHVPDRWTQPFFMTAVPGKQQAIIAHKSRFSTSSILRPSNSKYLSKEAPGLGEHYWKTMGIQACRDYAGTRWMELTRSRRVNDTTQEITVTQYQSKREDADYSFIYAPLRHTVIPYRSEAGCTSLAVFGNGNLVSTSPGANTCAKSEAYRRVHKYPELDQCQCPGFRAHLLVCAGPPLSNELYVLNRGSNNHAATICLMIYNLADGSVKAVNEKSLYQWSDFIHRSEDIDNLRWHLMSLTSDGRLVVVYSAPSANELYAMSIIDAGTPDSRRVSSKLVADGMIVDFKEWQAVMLPGDAIGVPTMDGKMACFK